MCVFEWCRMVYFDKFTPIYNHLKFIFGPLKTQISENYPQPPTVSYRRVQ